MGWFVSKETREAELTSEIRNAISRMRETKPTWNDIDPQFNGGLHNVIVPATQACSKWVSRGKSKRFAVVGAVLISYVIRARAFDHSGKVGIRETMEELGSLTPAIVALGGEPRLALEAATLAGVSLTEEELREVARAHTTSADLGLALFQLLWKRCVHPGLPGPT